ncbi:hypothetical protein [Paraburkholderia sp. RL17-373-BIF-A]|uniref:hypothetical protein n=1 Tax=Paraburkholderia sp. RL17-373-BIF-A TaxID=3031629 RepID=UPI0038B6F3C4
MRTLRKSLLMAAMAAALPFYMADETASAAPGEDPNAGASAAAASQESGTTQSATTATTGSDTDGTAAGDAGNASAATASSDTSSTSQATDATQTTGDAGNAAAGADASTGATASAAASSGNAPLNENTGKVEIATGSHAEAKDRFAGLLARLHQFENEAIDELRADLVAIGTLLHLHSKASTTAQTTGDYKAEDLS